MNEELVATDVVKNKKLQDYGLQLGQRARIEKY